MAFLPGQCGTRYGHSATAASFASAVASFINWLFVAVGAEVSAIAAYLPATGVVTYNLTTPGTATIMSQTGAYGAALSPAGERLYATFYNSSALGIAGGQVYGWNVGADPLFAAPVTFAPTVTEPSAGVVTAGQHRIGYLLQTRNGYTTLPCPANGSTQFSPVTFTSSGSKNLQVVIAPSPSWPTYAANVQIVMTTAANLNQYYTVPGAVSIAGGSSTVTIPLSISDSDLAATGQDVTPYLSLLTSKVGGAPPFFPYFCFTYSSRMAYFTLDPFGFPTIYFSEPNNYQYITADQHAVYLDGQERPISGFSLRGACYILTKTKTFVTEDSGQVPVLWTAPQLIDASIGTLSPKGTCVNASTGLAWVASEKGLYCFEGGLYPQLPVSFWQSTDWNRINWSGAGASVEVLDDPLNRRVIVKAPLDGATTPTHLLTWDYTAGVTPDAVSYSLDNMVGYALGASGMVLNPANGLLEVWHAPSAAGAVIRQNNGTETFPYRDVETDGVTASAINAQYQTGLIPGPVTQQAFGLNVGNSTLLNFFGAHLRVRGNGGLTLLAAGVDNVRQVTPLASPLALTTAPGDERLVKWFLRNEQQTITFGSNAIDAWFVLSLARVYFGNAMAQRVNS